MAENDNEYLKMLALAQQQAGQRVKGYGNFQYSMEPDYQKALQAVTNPKAFSYDAASDPLYAQYADQYRREGSLAMEDTLGKISARTGGLASSYATTAAQQENDRYAQALADKIPELYNQAYNRYLQEYQQQLQGLNALQADRQQAYGMWGDQYNRLLNQYNLAADAENQAYNRYWGENDRAYNREQDNLNWEYKNALAEADAKQQEWENQVKLANMGASVNDYSGYEALGLKPNLVTGGYYGSYSGKGESGNGEEGNAEEYNGVSIDEINKALDILDKDPTNAGALTVLLTAGLISQETYNAWLAAHQPVGEGESKRVGDFSPIKGLANIPISGKIPAYTDTATGTKRSAEYNDVLNQARALGASQEAGDANAKYRFDSEARAAVQRLLMDAVDKGQITVDEIDLILDELGL